MQELLMVDNSLSTAVATAVVFERDEFAEAHMASSTPDTREVIFQQWPRASVRTFFADPSTATGEAANWAYDSSLNTFYHPNNTSTTEMILSPYTLSGDYELDVVMTSYNADDDVIGVVIAFQETGTSSRFLSLWIHTGGLGFNQLSLGYGDETNGALTGTDRSYGDIVMSRNVIERRVAADGGWGGNATDTRQFYIRANIQKIGNNITAIVSDWNDLDNLNYSTEMSISFSELPRDGSLLQNNTRFGFGTSSQASAYFIDYSITSPMVVDQSVIYSSESGNKWEFNETTSSWDLKGNTITEDFTTSTVIKSITTNIDYRIDNASLISIRDSSISDNDATINLPINTNTNVTHSELISYFSYINALQIDAVAMTSNIDAVYENADSIDIVTSDIDGFIIIRLVSSNNVYDYRKVLVNVQ